MFCFTCNHVTEIKIISAAERVLKVFQNYFGDNEDVKNIHELLSNSRNNFEIISGKFPHAEIKLFQADVNEG